MSDKSWTDFIEWKWTKEVNHIPILLVIQNYFFMELNPEMIVDARANHRPKENQEVSEDHENRHNLQSTNLKNLYFFFLARTNSDVT